MYTKILMSLFLISALNAELPPSENYIEGVSAMGFQYDSGAVWAALCKNTPHGTMPGKFDGKAAYYPWLEKEHKCVDYELIYGKFVPATLPLPEGCEPRGFEFDIQGLLYNVVIFGPHGLIPGKAFDDLSWAFYSWNGKEYASQSDFYVICYIKFVVVLVYYFYY